MDRRAILDKIKEYIREFALLVGDLSLYPATHSHIQFHLEETFKALALVFEELDLLKLEVIEDCFAFEGIPFYEIRNQTDRTAALCKSKKICHIIIERGVTKEQLCDCASLIQDKQQAPDAETIMALLKARGNTKIVIDSLETTEQTSSPTMPLNGKKIYGASIEANRHIYNVLQAGQALPLEVVNTVSVDIANMIRRIPDVGLALSTLRNYDEYTFTHSINVAILSVTMAAVLIDDPDLLTRFARAAILHDIGKTRIPLQILNKPDKLTPEEWRTMQLHTLFGVLILEEQKHEDHLPSLIAAQHHMKYNLMGYPQIEEMTQLHPFSLILSICDIYDAITSDRAYKKGLPPDKALIIMMPLSGTDIFPYFFKIFLQTVGIYPPGSFVRLSSGELAIVERTRPQTLLQPEIKIIGDSHDQLLAEPLAIHLAADNRKRFIVNMVSPQTLGLDALDFIG